MIRPFAFAALLAATALSPALAQVQVEGPGEPRERPELAEMRQQAREARQAQRDAAPPPAQPRGDGGWGGARSGGQPPQQADGANGGWRGRGGGWQPREQAPVPVAQPQPVPQAPAATQPGNRWQRGEGGWGNRDGGNPNWGNRDGNGAPRRDWNRAAPSGQIGQPPAAPPPVVNRDPGRWSGGQPGVDRRDTWRDNRSGNAGNRWNRNDGWNADRARQPDRNWNNRNWNGNNGWNGNRGWTDNRRWNDNRGWDNRNWNNNRAWSRDWRRDQRYDWQRYRWSNRDLYRARPYYAPYGWSYGYRRFSIGIYLSNVLFDQRYWIDDPWDYRLPEVYGPYRWVRYYDDVLLVDLRSGQVVDVIHDFFW